MYATGVALRLSPIHPSDARRATRKPHMCITKSSCTFNATRCYDENSSSICSALSPAGTREAAEVVNPCVSLFPTFDATLEPRLRHGQPLSSAYDIAISYESVIPSCMVTKSVYDFCGDGDKRAVTRISRHRRVSRWTWLQFKGRIYSILKFRESK
jgi:hypothetical protein